MVSKWYVVQVFSSQEKRVKKAIEENCEASGISFGQQGIIEKVLLPTENVSEVKRGQQKVVEKRLWPGYLLIKMQLNDETWHYIKNINGVIDFLGGSKPNELSDEEVSTLLQDLEDKRHTVTQKHRFEVGDKVKITDGVFVNFVGTVSEVSHEKGRLTVMVSIFGRDTKVEDLEFWQVEAVLDEVTS